MALLEAIVLALELQTVGPRSPFIWVMGAMRPTQVPCQVAIIEELGHLEEAFARIMFGQAQL